MIGAMSVFIIRSPCCAGTNEGDGKYQHDKGSPILRWHTARGMRLTATASDPSIYRSRASMTASRLPTHSFLASSPVLRAKKVGVVDGGHRPRRLHPPIANITTARCMPRACGTARARLLLLLACMHATLGGDAGQGGIVLYDHLYEDGFYVKAHWDVGNQEAFLHDVLIADSGPRGQLFAENKAAVVLDAGAARGAVLHWLEQVQKYRRIEAAMGMELSGVAVQSTPWPYLTASGQASTGKSLRHALGQQHIRCRNFA